MLRRAHAVLAGLIAAATATGVAHDDASGGGLSGCPKKSNVLAQTGTMAVVRRQPRGIVACLTRAPTSFLLTEEYFETFYRSPALAIKGRRVAYAVTNFEDPDDAEDTTIYLLDLGRIENDGSTVAPPAEYFAARVGSSIRVARIVLRSDGVVAWIACDAPLSSGAVRGKPGEVCSRRGLERLVFAVTSDGRQRELARGKTVDPQVLRLQGNGRVAWRANGRTRSARVR